MKQRLAKPSDVVDLNGIKELAGIKVDGNGVTIGGMTRHADVASSADVKKAIPALAHLAGHIGDPAVRNRGTMGGSVANNDPAADYPAAVVALNATVTTNEPHDQGRRLLQGPVRDRARGRRADHLDQLPEGREGGLHEVPQPGLALRHGRRVRRQDRGGVRVAVTGAGPCVFRVKAMEDALAKNFSSDAIKDIKVPADGLNSDIHGSAEYRAHLVTVMARRAVDQANK